MLEDFKTDFVENRNRLIKDGVTIFEYAGHNPFKKGYKVASEWTLYAATYVQRHPVQVYGGVSVTIGEQALSSAKNGHPFAAIAWGTGSLGLAFAGGYLTNMRIERRFRRAPGSNDPR